MNKIIIKEDNIDVLDVNNDIEVLFNSKTEFFTVNIITINVDINSFVFFFIVIHLSHFSI